MNMLASNVGPFRKLSYANCFPRGKLAERQWCGVTGCPSGLRPHKFPD